MSYTKSMLELSIIIPAYNEEGRLLATLQSVHQFLTGYSKTFEIIVVDDGSQDHTSEVITAFGSHHDNIRLVSYQPNKGKGHAIRIGMLAGRGERLLMNDADGSSPIEEIAKLDSSIAAGADIAIGSRAKPDESRHVEALVHRKFIGNTFNAIVQRLLLPGILDTQCGFKMFRRAAAHDLFSVARIDGFAFDVEILYLARMRGYKVEEIAINWANMEGSKVNVLIDSPKMFLEVIGVALGAKLGVYKKQPPKSPILGGLISSREQERQDAS